MRNVILWIIACFIAANNSYQFIGTNYKTASAIWVFVSFICFMYAVLTLINYLIKKRNKGLKKQLKSL